jgi:death on curing protein
VGDDVPAEFGLLESAVMRPQTTVGGADAYPSIHDKAAAMFHSLVRSHPFLDGNKRTAVAAMVVLYRLNGWRIEMEQGDMVALALDIAEGQISVEAIAGVLKNHAVETMYLNDEEPDN